jgi:hypothetical protein
MIREDGRKPSGFVDRHYLRGNSSGKLEDFAVLLKRYPS